MRYKAEKKREKKCLTFKEPRLYTFQKKKKKYQWILSYNKKNNIKN